MTISIHISEISVFLEYGQFDFCTGTFAGRCSVNSPICLTTSSEFFKGVSRYGCTSKLTAIKELRLNVIRTFPSMRNEPLTLMKFLEKKCMRKSHEKCTKQSNSDAKLETVNGMIDITYLFNISCFRQLDYQMQNRICRCNLKADFR